MRFALAEQAWHFWNGTTWIAANALPFGPAGGDLTGTFPNPTVVGLQGRSVPNLSPSQGQVLQWNGTEWVPGTIPSGGSGGGGVTYFLNENTAPDAPTAGLAGNTKELGVVADALQTTSTKINVSTGGTFDEVAAFVTDLNVPDATAIPAGLWDFNIWATTTAAGVKKCSIRTKLYKYDGTTATLLSTAEPVLLFNGATLTQYAVTIVVPPTAVLVTDRLYVTVEATAVGASVDVTLYFGNNTPSHVLSTVQAVQGTGVLHVINGVLQSPATPVSLTADVSGVLPIANGGTNTSAIPTDGQLLIGNGTDYTLNTLAADPGISVANGPGTITVGNTGILAVGVAAPITSTGGQSPTIGLAASGVAAGSYGTASAVSTIAVTSQGIVTSAVDTPIQIAEAQVTNLTSDLAGKVPTTRAVNAGTGLTGGGALTSDVTIAMPNVGTAGTYGSASVVPVTTTDAQGRVSNVVNTSIQIAEAQVTNLTSDLAGKVPTTRAVNAGTGLTGGGALTSDVTIAMPNVGTAGTYGSASSVAVVTTDAQGRVSNAVTTPINISAAQVTSGTFPPAVSVQNMYQQASSQVSGGSAALAYGEVIYYTTSGGSASTPAVDRARANVAATCATTMGLVAQTSIPNGTSGTVITQGILVGNPLGNPPYLNTNAFQQGDILYVDTAVAGVLTNVKPTYPNVAIPVGIVLVRNQYTGAIYVNPTTGLDATPNVKTLSGSSKITLSAPGTTSIAATLFNGPPAVEYLALDFSGAGNVTLSGGPIASLTANDYGRNLIIHNVSTKTVTFNAGGTTFLSGGVALVLNPNSLVSFMWSFVGGGVGRWLQMTPAITVT